MPTFDFHIGRSAAEALENRPTLRISEAVHEAAFSHPLLRERGGRGLVAMRDFYRRATTIDDQEARLMLNDVQSMRTMAQGSDELAMFLDALSLLLDKAVRDGLVVVCAGP